MSPQVSCDNGHTQRHRSCRKSFTSRRDRRRGPVKAWCRLQTTRGRQRMYDTMLAESVTITGHDGDEIEAYSARTLQAGPVGGVVVIHHMPGYDRQTKEFTRALAAGGLNAVMPNLYSREAPGADPDDATAAARAAGVIPIPHERSVGQDAGAAAYLRGL